MATQSHFKPAAKRSSVQGNDNGFRRGLNLVDHFGQVGLQRRFAKFTNVSASDKCSPSAVDDDGLNVFCLGRSRHTVRQSGAYRLRKGIHRRV